MTLVSTRYATTPISDNGNDSKFPITLNNLWQIMVTVSCLHNIMRDKLNVKCLTLLRSIIHKHISSLFYKKDYLLVTEKLGL